MDCECRHRSYEDLDRRLRKRPGSVTSMVDADLAHVAHPLPTDPLIAPKIIGEAFVRRWLYEDRCPKAVVEITARRGFLTVADHFARRAVPLRNHRPTDRVSFAHELDGSFESPFDQRAWTYIHDRLMDFLECDGIFPLVARRDCADAVAVPFRFLSGARRRGHVLNRAGEPIPSWAPVVRSLDADLGGSHAVRVSCEFADGADHVQGGSLAFALVVARHIKRGRLEMPPLEVLATGAVREGRLHSVEGVAAKQKLGERLGCSLFIAPGFNEDKFVLYLAPKQSVKDVAVCLKRELERLSSPPRRGSCGPAEKARRRRRPNPKGRAC